MSTLPIAAFPVGTKATNSSTFVVAVLVGLTLYIASQNPAASKASQLQR